MWWKISKKGSRLLTSKPRKAQYALPVLRLNQLYKTPRIPDARPKQWTMEDTYNVQFVYTVSHVLVQLFSFFFENMLQQGFYSPIKAIVSLVVGRVCHTSEPCLLQTISVTNLSKTSEPKYCIRLPFRKVYHWSSHVKTKKTTLSNFCSHYINSPVCVSKNDGS